MEQLNSEDLPIIARALAHYSKLVRDLTNDQDIANKMKPLSEIELSNYLDRANGIMANMDDGNSGFNLIYNNKDFVSDALSSYSKYLDELKKSIYEKIGATPKFVTVETEIEAIERIQRTLRVNIFHNP